MYTGGSGKYVTIDTDRCVAHMREGEREKERERERERERDR